MQRKQKQIESLHELPPYTVIFSEGTKTEPYYISGMANVINSKYAAFGKENRIVVIGTGRNTQDLLRHARNVVEDRYTNSQVVYLMYDKDDFPLDNFDNTQFGAEGKQSRQEYRVAWSNECIELWFVLHFQELEANVCRSQYHEILKRYLSYEKNLDNIYELLCDRTEMAIKRARNLMAKYEPNTPPSQCAPATRVHELVDFLRMYL